MPKLRLLDLYCGAGGAGMGYIRAGFKVTGVDINPQPNYPSTFIQGDAIEYLREHGHEFDVIHASPPCQRYSVMSNCRPGLAAKYPDLVDPTRKALDLVGVPYVIENVTGAPLRPDLMLCGHMVGLELYRHRIFESTMKLKQLAHPPHLIPGSRAAHWTPGTIMSVSGGVYPIAKAREVMGMDWTTRKELAEAIPPAYTEYIGRQLKKKLKKERKTRA